MELRKHYNNIITIIAPRHIDRVSKINSLSKKFNFKTQILDKDENIIDDVEIIIINSFGVLQNYFRNAKSVFIGKSTIDSLKNDSGQNPIDAAYLNCKIYHGPYVSNFNEIYEILGKNGITQEINNYKELSNNLINDLRDPRKMENFYSNTIQSLGKDILNQTMKILKNFIDDKN
jgi:3-deoxy-D-manno-octulosonic-acid transferase